MTTEKVNETLANAYEVVTNSMTADTALQTLQAGRPEKVDDLNTFATAQKVLAKEVVKEIKLEHSSRLEELKQRFNEEKNALRVEYTTPYKLFNKAKKNEKFMELCNSLGFNGKKIQPSNLGCYWNEERKVFVLPVTFKQIASSFKTALQKGLVDETGLNVNSNWFKENYVSIDNDTFFKIQPFTISVLCKILNRLINDYKKDLKQRIKSDKLTAKEKQTESTFYRCLLFDPAFEGKSDEELRKEAKRRFIESLKHPELAKA